MMTSQTHPVIPLPALLLVCGMRASPPGEASA